MSFHVRDNHVIDLVTLTEFPFIHRESIRMAINCARDAKRRLRSLGRLASDDTAAARTAWKKYMTDSGTPEPTIEFTPTPWTPSTEVLALIGPDSAERFLARAAA